MGTPEDEDFEPSWLDTENDQLHRKEVEPLIFGTGKLSLNDPDENDDAVIPYGNVDHQSKKEQKSDNVSETDWIIGSSKSKSSKQSTKSKKQDYGSTGDTSRKSFWTLPTDATTPVIKINDSEDNDDDDNIDGDGDGNNSDANNNDSTNANNEEGRSDANTLNDRPGRPDQPRQKFCVKVFSAITVFGLITNMSLIVSQVLPMFFYPMNEFQPTFLALKMYLCIFAIIFIVIEVDNNRVPFFRDAVFLTTYATRGFLYTFFGLICFDLANSEESHQMVEDAESRYPTVDVSWFAWVDEVTAWELISLGILYFLMGIFCLQKARHRWDQEEQQVWKNYREAVKTWENERV